MFCPTKRFAVGFALMVLAFTSNASLLVTLTNDGSNGVLASFEGSGVTTADDNDSDLWYADGMGAFTSGDFNGVTLTPSVAFNASLDIIRLDILTIQGGLFSMNLDGFTGGSGTQFDISGSATLGGIAFSDLNVGTYTSGGNINEIGDFTLVVERVPEPVTLALFVIGILGAGVARRRKIEAQI